MYGNPYYDPYPINKDELEHYGIKGMKWGEIKEDVPTGSDQRASAKQQVKSPARSTIANKSTIRTKNGTTTINRPIDPAMQSARYSQMVGSKQGHPWAGKTTTEITHSKQTDEQARTFESKTGAKMNQDTVSRTGYRKSRDGSRWLNAECTETYARIGTKGATEMEQKYGKPGQFNWDPETLEATAYFLDEELGALVYATVKGSGSNPSPEDIVQAFDVITGGPSPKAVKPDTKAEKANTSNNKKVGSQNMKEKKGSSGQKMFDSIMSNSSKIKKKK